MSKVLALQNFARTQHDKRPFAAILVGPDHGTVLLMHQSVSHVDHAEASLARLSSLHYSQAYLCKDPPVPNFGRRIEEKEEGQSRTVVSWCLTSCETSLPAPGPPVGRTQFI